MRRASPSQVRSVFVQAAVRPKAENRSSYPRNCDPVRNEVVGDSVVRAVETERVERTSFGLGDAVDASSNNLFRFSEGQHERPLLF